MSTAPAEVFIQATTGTVHRIEDCSVARRTRYGTIPAKLDSEVSEALTGGIYSWCKKCGQ